MAQGSMSRSVLDRSVKTKPRPLDVLKQPWRDDQTHENNGTDFSPVSQASSSAHAAMQRCIAGLSRCNSQVS